MGKIKYIIPRLAWSIRTASMPVIVVYENGKIWNTEASKKTQLLEAESPPLLLFHLYESNRGRRKITIYYYKKEDEIWKPEFTYKINDNTPPLKFLDEIRQILTITSGCRNITLPPSTILTIIEQTSKWLYPPEPDP